jgi:FixJ family two-component response regulator
LACNEARAGASFFVRSAMDVRDRVMGNRRISEDGPLIGVVDDSEPVREALDSRLRAEGFRVATFTSAEAFLAFDAAHEVSSLILDIGLPGMSGLELQAHLTRNGLRIPIVFMTAREDYGGRLRAQAINAGAVDFLHKPFAVEDLIRAIEAAVARN